MRFRITLLTMVAVGLFAACSAGSENAENDEATAQQAIEKGETTETAEEPAAEPESQPQTSGGMHHAMKDRCPMHVEGTRLTVEDTETGVAVVFTNEANAVEVQERTAKLGGHHEMAMQHHGSSLPAFSVTAENTENGAKLLMNAEDPAQAKALQTQLKARFEAQGEKKCPMKLMYDHEPKKRMKHKGKMHQRGMQGDG